MTAEDFRTLRRALAERYPERDLLPFARRQDNDDVACWSSETPGAVFIVHDFASGRMGARGRVLWVLDVNWE